MSAPHQSRQGPRPLRRHLAVLLALKFCALLAIWWFFFRPELRPSSDSAAVAEQVLAAPEPVRQQQSGSSVR